MAIDRPRVLICVLTGPERHQWINPSLVGTLLDAVLDQRFATDVGFIYGMRNTREARNQCVTRARNQHSDWLVIVDADYTIADLMGIVDEARRLGVEIVSLAAGSIQKDASFKVSVSAPGERLGNFSRVTMAGLGVLLLKSTVWGTSDGPLFESPSDCDENVAFFRAMQAAQFKIWTHGQLAGHLQTTDVTGLLEGVR